MIPAQLIPWLILAFTLTVGAAGATGYWKGGQHKADEIAAQQAREVVLTEKARDEALQAAADRIVKLDVKNTTIRQKTEVITREVPVYNECRHDPRTLGLLNDALAPGSEAQPPSDGKLPRPDAP